jgi:hypothetical protein
MIQENIFFFKCISSNISMVGFMFCSVHEVENINSEGVPLFRIA